MKTLCKAKLITLVIVIAGLNVGRAQEADATKEIKKTIRDYFAAMSARDVQGLRAVLDKRFVAVEAADKNAEVHFVDTGNAKELLPPEGNDDWDKDKIRLSSVKAEVSATHPSVAMASFTLTFPLDDQRVAGLEAALKQLPADFDESQRKAAARIIADRAVTNAMFAMLARQHGKWKIVCMSLPK
jgi:hypothetical protein